MNIDTELLDDNAIILDGLDHCVIGFSTKAILIYSHDKLIEHFENEGMTAEEALEWIDYNILGLICNGSGFEICYTI